MQKTVLKIPPQANPTQNPEGIGETGVGDPAIDFWLSLVRTLFTKFDKGISIVSGIIIEIGGSKVAPVMNFTLINDETHSRVKITIYNSLLLCKNSSLFVLEYETKMKQSQWQHL